MYLLYLPLSNGHDGRHEGPGLGTIGAMYDVGTPEKEQVFWQISSPSSDIYDINRQKEGFIISEPKGSE